jgi:hypothetical protein
MAKIIISQTGTAVRPARSVRGRAAKTGFRDRLHLVTWTPDLDPNVIRREAHERKIRSSLLKLKLYLHPSSFHAFVNFADLVARSTITFEPGKTPVCGSIYIGCSTSRPVVMPDEKPVHRW